MIDNLTISLTPENADFGSEAERATFGLFAMTANEHLLTAGEDMSSSKLLHGPYIPGCHIAEWLVWNWWRLRWEVRQLRRLDEDTLVNWNFAHQMSTIGEGYVWPNVTIFSDGVWSCLSSEPSIDPEAVLFRYLGASGRQWVRAETLENAIDGFVEDILMQLDRKGIRNSNLHRLWNDLSEERENPELACYRRLEAQLGYEPDEADESELKSWLENANKLGEKALGEIVADVKLGDHTSSRIFHERDFVEIAERDGFEANPDNAIKLDNMTDISQPAGSVQAWNLGQLFAQGIRSQEKLRDQPICNQILTSFAGAMENAISGQSDHPAHNISFALDRSNNRSYVSLRSSRQTGRRFDLARLIGDRVFCTQMYGSTEPLLPATRTYSYRQKLQRAFAAELLSPFTCVDDMMEGDYDSEEKQNEVANHFNVSPWTIRTQLLNNGRIDSEDARDITGRLL